jgi:hypothetical protein
MTDDSFPLGPCFTAPKLAPCPHPDNAKFAWFARDDTAKDGQVYCVVCMSCGAVLFVGETQATRGLARIRQAREKAERQGDKETS